MKRSGLPPRVVASTEVLTAAVALDEALARLAKVTDDADVVAALREHEHINLSDAANQLRYVRQSLSYVRRSLR